MNRLVEEIIKPILEANGIKKVIGIYGGRFQPFGPHHLKTYKWLQSKVDEAYITTSNIKKPPRHPMNFKEKVRHMSKMGVPSNRIIEEKSPYVAKNLAKKYDKDTTAFVYVFGQKDAGRLGGKYFKDYKKSKGNINGYEENGYYLVAPHVSISVGGKEVSGTTMRELLGSDKFDDKQRAKLFKKMFGYFNQGVFNMMVNKFKKLFEQDVITWDNTKQKKLKKKFKDGKDKELIKGQVKEFTSGYPNKEDMKKIKKRVNKARSKSDSNKEYQYHPVSEGLPTKVTDKFKKMKLGKNKWTDAEKDFYLHHRGDNIGIGAELDTYDGDDDDKEKGGVQPNEKDKKKKGYEPVTEIELPIEIGDTIKVGRFKNKSIVIKTIDFNEKGDLLINGKSVMRFRIVKEFLSNIDFNEIIKEATSTSTDGGGVVDDGPTFGFGDIDNYAEINDIMARKLGFKIVDFIVNTPTDDEPDTPEYKNDGAVSYGPAGVGTGRTPNNQIDLTGSKVWTAWEKYIDKIAATSGMKFMSYLLDKDIIKQTSKDSTQTKKLRDKENPAETEPRKYVEEQLFTKQWWNTIINEKVGVDNLMDVAKQLTYDYKVNPKLKLVTTLKKGDYAHFDFDRNTILISKKATKNLKEFLISILHEIDHARDFKKMGKKFIQDYEKYSNMIAQGMMKGKSDPYWDNPYEIKAEKFGRKEANKYNIKDLFGESLQENIVTKTQLKPRGKELLLMGGAYGHMAHPFDDKDLTFGDLKKIITDGLGGQLNREDNVTEKLDGQNIMISWKDGKLIAARNKGHIKNGGKTALDAKGIASKFKGRGNIADAFNFAMKDLGKSIGALSEKQRTKIFNNGKHFMNLEVMWPKSANVIDYDVAELIFHGALIYDDKGNVKGEVKGSGRILAGMIKQVNQHIGKKYSISKPVFLTIPKHQDFGKKKDKFLGRLNKLRTEYGLKDNDTLGLYHQKWWEAFILNKKKDVSSKVLEGLVRRWAFFEKKYSIPMMRKDIEDEKFLEFVLDFDKKNHAKQVKENMRPFEVLFFEVGAEILKNVEGFIAANPDKAVQNMKKNLKKAISVVKSGGDIKKLNRLKVQLDRLNAIGGTKAIVPSEGIVFKYKGKTYKFTGAFAPVNQITGLIYF